MEAKTIDGEKMAMNVAIRKLIGEMGDELNGDIADILLGSCGDQVIMDLLVEATDADDIDDYEAVSKKMNSIGYCIKVCVMNYIRRHKDEYLPEEFH